MQRIYDFDQRPATRNYTVADLEASHGEVTAKRFPYPEQCISMQPEDKEKFLEALDKLN